ncbi:MAG: TetR family transcriptional regulator [Candidatus Competibacterales bacterium]|nr:TetR family transcriptional regulator [Candidatus Competibacterales bacterium]
MMTTPERDRLLTAAKQRFRRMGLHATGIAPLCAAAGVVRMTLCKHLPSRETLVLAVLRACHVGADAAPDGARRMVEAMLRADRGAAS